MTTARGRERQRGSVLLAVVLLVSLMAAMVATYSRSALLEATKSSGDDQDRTKTAVQSGIAFADKSLQAGRSGNTVVLAPSGASVSIDVIDQGAGRMGIQISSQDEGRTRAVSGVADVHPVEGSELPSLSASARDAVMAAGDLTVVGSDRKYRDEAVSGTFVVMNGVKLTFENCVVTGVVVDEASATDTPLAEGDSPAVLALVESVVINTGEVLPGCGIVMREGHVEAKNKANVELHGAVVASVFDGTGDKTFLRIHDQLITGTLLGGEDAGFVQLKTTRAPLDQPEAFAAGSVGISRIEFSHGGPTQAEKDAILAFDLASHLASDDGDPEPTAPQGAQTPMSLGGD